MPLRYLLHVLSRLIPKDIIRPPGIQDRPHVQGNQRFSKLQIANAPIGKRIIGSASSVIAHLAAGMATLLQFIDVIPHSFVEVHPEVSMTRSARLFPKGDGVAGLGNGRFRQWIGLSHPLKVIVETINDIAAGCKIGGNVVAPQVRVAQGCGIGDIAGALQDFYIAVGVKEVGGPEVGTGAVGIFGFVVVDVHPQGQVELAKVIVAGDPLANLLGFGQGRQKHSRQDGNDGDDHQQFNQGKSAR